MNRRRHHDGDEDGYGEWKKYFVAVRITWKSTIFC